MSDELMVMEEAVPETLDPCMERYEAVKREYASVKEREETKDNGVSVSEAFMFDGILGGIKKLAKTATGIQGLQDRKSAKNLKEACSELSKAASDVTEDKRKRLNDEIISFGKCRLEALQRTVGRFLIFLEDMKQKNKTKEYEMLDDLGLDVKTIEEMKTIEMSASKALASTAITGALGAAAAMGTPALVTGAVTLIGAASTGTAISTLSGAAASNAILAWLGGGALAAGGGGVAAGSAVLAGITVGATAGVAILAAGLMASVHYAKKLTEAKEYQKDVEVAVAEMEKAWAVMGGISKRTEELVSVTSDLEKRTVRQLEYMEPLTIDFDTGDEYYNTVFQKTGLLVKTMSELSKTPLLDNEGNVSMESVQIIAKTHSILNTELMNHE
jgi:hypothetical protein